MWMTTGVLRETGGRIKERTLGIVREVATRAEPVRGAAEDLEVILRLILDEDVFRLATRFGREGHVGF
jgi:hypothetical protein